ncbi:hypothetical protein M378DRAFT_155370 [Amanita muscaria Koide BX008]|uniref:Secreted protein n=1 Tax=Amanita muscaria (strain Koide BX008) TaxID=946122 RepID=A0A0C2XRA2_AMAMK|nr:hypothetical protein M378DRAFT_155370 [Amanita muscaria Koide BX008]
MVFFSCAAFFFMRCFCCKSCCKFSFAWSHGLSISGRRVRNRLPRHYSRLVRGTAPWSGIAQGSGVSHTYQSSAAREQYSNGFTLVMRMISVAAGVMLAKLLGPESTVLSSLESQIIMHT